MASSQRPARARAGCAPAQGARRGGRAGARAGRGPGAAGAGAGAGGWSAGAFFRQAWFFLNPFAGRSARPEVPGGGGGAMAQDPLVLFPAPGGRVPWGALDDVVMGGASSSRMVLRDAGAAGAPPATPSGADVAGVFAGVVTEANNGGFASVRTRNFAPALDLTGFTGIRLRCRGNGLRYKMILRTDAAWDGPSYCRSFDTAAGEWAEVELPFAAFVATRRARTLPDGPPLDARRITSLQLMLSKFEYDGELNPAFRAGPFELPIATIEAFV